MYIIYFRFKHTHSGQLLGAPGGLVVPAPLVMVTKKMVALDEPMF
jgi:hypothetical protein